MNYELSNEKHRYKELSVFLQTRRAKVLPSQVGLPSGMRRRIPGLRREEVAQLAGIGLTWYTWLEQGRPIRVSASIIESLSRVLLLDKQERNHLYSLANQPLPAETSGYQGIVSPMLQNILNNLTLCPSLITDQRFNVIAWNAAACVIFGDFSKMSVRERNIVWAMFTDDKYKNLYIDWNRYAKGLIGRFRLMCGKYVEDSWLIQFVDDLRKQSSEFNLWWSLHELQNNAEICKQLKHPVVGILDYEISNFDVSNDSGLKLVIHVPSAGTDTDIKMKALLDTYEDNLKA